MEKHTDVLDAASELQQATLNSQLAEARKLSKPRREPLGDGSFKDTDCDECGLTIPVERMKVAIRNDLCLGCAEALEKINKRWAR